MVSDLVYKFQMTCLSELSYSRCQFVFPANQGNDYITEKVVMSEIKLGLLFMVPDYKFQIMCMDRYGQNIMPDA